MIELRDYRVLLILVAHRKKVFVQNSLKPVAHRYRGAPFQIWWPQDENLLSHSLLCVSFGLTLIINSTIISHKTHSCFVCFW